MSYKKWFVSLLLSTTLHLACVLVLAQLMMSAPASSEGGLQLDTRWQDDEPVALAPLEPLQQETEPEPALLSSARSVLQAAPRAMAIPELPVTDPLVPLNNSWETGLDNLDLTGTLEGGPAGRGQNAGTGGSGLFSEDVTGKNIVYVVDSSASMNSPYPGPEKTRFGRVKVELIQAIRSMSPDRKFFIVFFNTEAMPMPGRRMVSASARAADDALIWMSKQKAEGETDPGMAIRFALSLRPDVIHFLTDGEIDPRMITSVKQLNRSGISINTYCISNRDGEQVVLKIARQNRGAYKFVP